VNGTAVFSDCSAKPIASASVFGEEDRLAIVPALDDVQWLIRQEMASKARRRPAPQEIAPAIARRPRRKSTLIRFSQRAPSPGTRE
jgi:hypothetical protein